MKIFVALLLAAAPLHAGPRDSTDYHVATDTNDGGGARSISADYAHDGSMTGFVGVATPTGDFTAKHGYVGQLYDVTGLALNAVSLTLGEGATDQLSAWQSLDDATFLAVPAASVAWSVTSGPLVSISAAGLATAGIVYEPTNALVQGIYLGQSGPFQLNVLDTIPDNFGAYAGDGLGDDWQVQYFGQNNPLAAPDVDPIGNGYTNRFKFIAGLNPLDPASRFQLTLAAVPGQPGQKMVTFSPFLPGRTYVITAKSSLTAPAWEGITASAPMDNGTERTVTDLNAGGGAKFYRVEITKP